MRSETVEPVQLCLLSNHPRIGEKPMNWSVKPELLDRDIMLFHDGLPFLPELAELAERNSEVFAPSTVIKENEGAYENGAQRNSRFLPLSLPELDPEFKFYNLLCQSVEPRLIETYLRVVNRHALVARSSGYELLRYREGQYFKEHVDVVKDHDVLCRRRLAVVAFCNDNFEGGDLVFPRQEVSIRPEPGLVVMFPAGFTHPHESTTIRRGTKYAVVTWYF